MTASETVSTIGLLGTILASLIGVIVLQIRSARDAKEAAYHSQRANSAVNNVGPGQHTLYDMVAKIEGRQSEFHDSFNIKGWPSLPSDIGTAAALTETIRDLQHQDAVLDDKLDQLLTEVRAHVKWEMDEKYR